MHAADKLIILLTAGAQSESVDDIRKAISVGKQLAGNTTILVFGLETGQSINQSIDLFDVYKGKFVSYDNM